MWKRLSRSLAFNIFLLVLAGAVGYEAYRTSRAVAVARREIARVDGEIEALARKRAELNAALLELRTPQAREREAKARLNLKRKGEEVVVVPPEKPPQPDIVPPSPFWSRLAGFLRRLAPF